MSIPAWLFYPLAALALLVVVAIVAQIAIGLLDLFFPDDFLP